MCVSSGRKVQRVASKIPTVSKLMTEFVLNDVIYDSQRNNSIDPSKTCFPTSISMVMRTLNQSKYLGSNSARYSSTNLEDMIGQDIINNLSAYRNAAFMIYGQQWVWTINPRHLGKWWVWYINNKCTGFEAEYLTFNRQGLKDFIKINKVPVVTATHLTGKGGHIVVTIGFDDEGFYANDPWGDANTKYKKKNGKGVYYLNEMYKKTIQTVVIWHS